ncbi:LLM class flavin-dependent oxidoreductase [Streptomyces sp. NPDC014006]|uniref:LLM class flavin-dependent oxidoreductase n=1 Tax=Streptomyces sp. NPDC014006 TaxID=3364870 RepID=UPI003700DD79
MQREAVDIRARARQLGRRCSYGEILQFSGIPPMTRPFRAGGPPVRLGGAAPAALARTGRMYDGWLPYPPDPAEYTSGLREVREAAAAARRSAGDITPALFVSVHIADDIGSGRQALDAYARVTYGVPLVELEKIQAVVTGTADRVVERLGQYVAAGARHIVGRLGALDLRSQREQLERSAELIPALRTAAGRAETPDREPGRP